MKKAENNDVLTGKNGSKPRECAKVHGTYLTSRPRNLLLEFLKSGFQCSAQHIQKLRKACLPEGSLEEETFRRYAFATFQISRVHALELQAQDRWVNDPDHPLQERRADKSLNEVRKLQRDRFAAL